MDESPIEIKILNEAPAVTPETSSKTSEIGKRLANTAVSAGQKAWQSDARKKVTAGVGKGITAVAAKGNQLVQERVVKAAEEQAKAQLEATKERIRQTDWQAEAKKGTASVLRWLSEKLKGFSDKVERSDEAVPENE